MSYVDETLSRLYVCVVRPRVTGQEYHEYNSSAGGTVVRKSATCDVGGFLVLAGRCDYPGGIKQNIRPSCFLL